MYQIRQNTVVEIVNDHFQLFPPTTTPATILISQAFKLFSSLVYISMDEPPLAWHPPAISLSSPPIAVAQGRPRESEEYPENFFRCAKWCPDGGCALDVDLVFRQPSPIVDFAWYPGATASNPSSYCFLASVRECPVKLLDASNGRLRASYKLVDHRERQIAPHCLAFNCMATHLYCGYEDAIEVFDFQQPGEGTKLPTTPSKKSRDGMKGIVSSISFCSDYSGLYAASSLASAIALFSEQTGADPVAYLDGMAAPVTQVKFDPMRPHILYAAQRRSNEILCWDVREPLEVLRSFARKSAGTNQKLLFDIDPAGRWLATGDQDGYISMFDLHTENSEPTIKFKAHDDSIGSLAFNPVDATLLSVSGSRHFDDSSVISHSGGSESSDSSDSESEWDEDDEGGYMRNYIRRRRQPIRPLVVDSSVKIWKFSPGEDVRQTDTGMQNQTMSENSGTG
ncbi:WD40 repeat-like protein [Sanghuangporus baumii]|uniref:WD40 repeat-like protein n=1 Tax=Sanghuangporus baumii TaxID=108892 RepID=A0A9Q5HZD7_SANBA|nr:WD40 repeat-like protein [Sanghuangporus baumii]